MTEAARAQCRRLLAQFAREAGRSAAIHVKAGGAEFTEGVCEEVARPAASLLKVPLVMAAEEALQDGSLRARKRIKVSDLLAGFDGPSALRVLSPGSPLHVAELIGLAIALSDQACSAWLLGAVGITRVRALIEREGLAIEALSDPLAAGGPLTGTATASAALRLIELADDPTRYPLLATSLEQVVQASRIPLGATEEDLRVAHKTGSLSGVANDVAVIECAAGSVRLAFLSEHQHDTLITGYEMGICTRGLLEASGLVAQNSFSLS